MALKLKPAVATPEGPVTYQSIRVTSGLSEMLDQLASLMQTEEGNEEFLAPTPQAAARMRALLEGASEFGPDAFPQGTICADGDGGLRLEWIRPRRELRLVIAASAQGRSYLYHEAGDDYGADYAPDAEKLGRRLDWLRFGGKAI